MLKDQLKHALQNVVAAIVVFVLAALLAYAERAAETLHLPEYCIYGIRTIAILLFVIDGIVLVGTAAVFAIKLLRKQWTNNDE